MKKIKEFVLQKVADEYMLIPTGKTAEEFHGMVTLSETAAFIWEHLEEAESPGALADRLAGEYDVDSETAKTDVTELVNNLVMRGLCAPDDPAKGW